MIYFSICSMIITALLAVFGFFTRNVANIISSFAAFISASFCLFVNVSRLKDSVTHSSPPPEDKQ